MSPRIRSLKPEIWDDEAVGAISRDARLLFVGLITQADDDGRLRGDPRLVGAQVFPYDALAPTQVEAWLEELAEIGLIVRYENADRPFIELPAWKRHQRINRASESAFPSPEADDSVRTHGTLSEDSRPHARAWIKEGRGEDQGEERIRIKERIKESSSSKNSVELPTQIFQFWVKAMEKSKRTRFTHERRKRVKERLAEGYSVDEIEQAISNVAG